MVQWGLSTGNGSYSYMFVTLPIAYKQLYFPYAQISWSTENNTWYTSMVNVQANALTDIAGTTGYENAKLNGFYLQSFSDHIYLTVGN